jgi:hypothetical protein
MAKTLAFPTRKAKKGARRLLGGVTFIQRSRNESSEQKAIWHQVTGAGRSHVMRQFFGLTEAEAAVGKAALEGMLETRLREAASGGATV